LPASLRDSSLFFARLAQRKQWCYSSIPPNPHPDRSQPTHTSYYTTTTSTTCAPSGPPSSLSHPSSPPPSLSFRLLYSAQSFCWLLLLSPHKSLPARPLRRPNFSLASLFFRLARRPRVVFLLLCALRVYHNCSAIRRLLQASRLSGSSGVGHCICARRFEVVSTVPSTSLFFVLGSVALCFFPVSCMARQSTPEAHPDQKPWMHQFYCPMERPAASIGQENGSPLEPQIDRKRRRIVPRAHRGGRCCRHGRKRKLVAYAAATPSFLIWVYGRYNCSRGFCFMRRCERPPDLSSDFQPGAKAGQP
jgi:hypothetical protein